MSTEVVHHLGGRAGLVSAHATRPAPALALSATEELAVRELVSDGADDVVLHVQQRAAALAGDAADGTGALAVRRRSLTRAVAIAEAQLAQLHVLLAVAVAKKDSAAVAAVDRALTGATKRFAILMDALRADEQRHQRPVVVVGAANAVNIGGGG